MARLAPAIDEARAILAAANCGLGTLDADGLARADAAAWLLLRHHLTRVASGVVDPWEGLEILEHEVRWPYLTQVGRLANTGQYACQSHDYHFLYGLYVAYGDLISRPHEVSWDGLYGDAGLVAWGRSVIAEATRWLERHAESAGAQT